MAKFYPELTEELQDFIRQQQLFFTATAPQDGRINLSPKGIDTFRILDANTVAYLDLTGSGNETSAHLLENSRMTLMFCSFTEKPWILRLYGQGSVIRPRDRAWAEMIGQFPTLAGTRQIFQMQVEAAQTSCGMGVPMYEFQTHRDSLIQWAEKKGEAGLQQYWQEKNQTSIDGLPTRILGEG
jgi:Pyridoxamine 5'-phosphate oxidase